MLCQKCGAFFGPKAANAPVLCHQCDDHHYGSATAIGIYEKALATTVLRLKREPVIPLRLIKIVKEQIVRCDLSHIDLVIPIPLSKQRKLERGFNQAEVIARQVAAALQKPVDAQSLTRDKHTPIHRVGMDKRARELTVTHAFAVVRPNLVKGKNILLVDDVLTSGSTASNCAKALKKAHAAGVTVFTLARAVMR